MTPPAETLTGYTVAVEPGQVVLDALHRLQATKTGDLAVRWNWKAGKRGSCSAEINGRPKLLSMTRLPAGPVTVAPLRTYPIIRNLVTGVSANTAKPNRSRPSPRRRIWNRAGGYRMAQVDIGPSQEFRTCIGCWLCQDVCHLIRDHEVKKRA